MANSFRIRMDSNPQHNLKLLRNICNDHYMGIMKSRKHELDKVQLSKMYGGNRAVVFWNIDGTSGTFHAHSSVSESNHPFKDVYEIKIPETPPRPLNHIDVDEHKNINLKGWKRDSDSEAKLLQKLATMYTNQSKGYIYLYTRYSPCLSCDYHIIQFIEKFPEIELHVSYDYDYPHKNQERHIGKK
ncbi:deaminase domain-containing protein [Bacillus cereus]|uniref:deaminase domain-containing protein n=1 Tax=Bacillus cereus TaxID=1396 RepID=UPI0025705CE7|nr:deaminase domain-containing protein [Bacillus cereus]WJE26680.1 deaminase domain-containing protein [Bacillus cereus]